MQTSIDWYASQAVLKFAVIDANSYFSTLLPGYDNLGKKHFSHCHYL